MSYTTQTISVTSTDIEAKSLSSSFDKNTGVVKVLFEHRNPRTEATTITLKYSLNSGGAWTTVSSSNYKGNWGNGAVLSETKWIKSSIDFDVYEILPLTYNATARVQLLLTDTDSNVVTLTESADQEWDLRPQGVKWVSPYDFGSDTTPDFIIQLPTLLRSQYIQPQLTIATNDTFTAGVVVFNNFQKEERNKGVSSFQSISGTSSVTLNVDANQDFETGDLISLYNSTSGNYNKTFAIASVDNTNNRVTINGDFSDGLLGASYQQPVANIFPTTASSSKFQYVGSNNTITKIKFNLASTTLSSGTDYYYKYDLRCTES